MSNTEQAPDVKKITVEFEDGETKQIEKGCCVDLENVEDRIYIAMLDIQPHDMVRLAYGLLMAVENMGMMDELTALGTEREEEEDEYNI